MKTIEEEINTTHLLIIILGATAIIGEIGTILLIYQQNLDIAVITGLLTFTGNITGGLIGYLGANNNNNNDESTEDTDDTNEDTTTQDVEVTNDVQHTQNTTTDIPEKQ